MAEHLIFDNRLGKILLGALLTASPLFAFAQSGQLVDPTRPPPSLANSAMGEPAAGEPAAPSGPVLQSIMVSPTRVTAIINGETVKVGDKVGDARVVKITDNEVTLRSGNETKVLKLFDHLQKNMSPQRGGLRVESRRP